MWLKCQDLLLSGLIVWTLPTLCLGGSIIKHQAQQTGAGETTWSLERLLRCRTLMLTHTITQEAHIWMHRVTQNKPSDDSHGCSHSQRHIPSLYLTVHTQYTLTFIHKNMLSVHSYIHTRAHTLKPLKIQVVMQFTRGLTLSYSPMRTPSYTHRDTGSSTLEG